MNLMDLTETVPLLKTLLELMATNRLGLNMAASTAWSPTCSNKPSAPSNAFPLTTTTDATDHDCSVLEEKARQVPSRPLSIFKHTKAYPQALQPSGW